MSDPEFLILDERDRDGSLSDFGVKNVLHVPIAHLQAVINHSQTDDEVYRQILSRISRSFFQSKNGLPKFLNEASLIVHCTHGSAAGRSFRGAEQLKEAGFNATMYKGGFMGWKEKFSKAMG